jgi:hypothetical protein
LHILKFSFSAPDLRIPADRSAIRSLFERAVGHYIARFRRHSRTADHSPNSNRHETQPNKTFHVHSLISYLFFSFLVVPSDIDTKIIKRISLNAIKNELADLSVMDQGYRKLEASAIRIAALIIVRKGLDGCI